MPNTDMLPYLMYKSIRETLKELRLHLDETLDRELSRISDKGASHSSVHVVLQREKSPESARFLNFPVISLKETSKRSASEKDSGTRSFYIFTFTFHI